MSGAPAAGRLEASWFDTAADALRYDDPSAGQWNVTPARWAEATRFARSTGLLLFFTLNEREPQLALLGSPDVAMWELGNEINGWPIVHGFDHALSGAQRQRELFGG